MIKLKFLVQIIVSIYRGDRERATAGSEYSHLYNTVDGDVVKIDAIIKTEMSCQILIQCNTIWKASDWHLLHFSA